MTTRLSVAKDKLKFVLLEGIHETALKALRDVDAQWRLRQDRIGLRIGLRL